MSYTYATSTSAGNASGNALACNKPASTANGDLLIAYVYWEGNSQSITLPSGWNLLRAADSYTTPNPDVLCLSCYKWASSEPASWTWTPSVNTNWRTIVVARYTPPGAGTSNPTDVSSGHVATSSASTETATTVTTTTASETVLGMIGNVQGTALAYFSGTASNARIQVGGVGIWDGTKATAGATGNNVWANSSVDYVAQQVALLNNSNTVLTFSPTGSLTDSGALTKVNNKSLAGALTDSGTLSKVHNEPLAGALTDSGTLTKVHSQPFAGTLTSSGALTSQKIKAVSLTGTLTDSGTLSKVHNEPLAGTLTDSGTLTKSHSKSFAGTLTDSATLAQVHNKPLAGTLTDSGTLSKVHNQTITGTLTDSGTLQQTHSKTLTGTLTDSGTLAAFKGKVLTVIGALTSAATITKLTSHALAGTLTDVGLLAKVVSKLLAGTLTDAGTLTKAHSKLFVGALTDAGTLGTSITHGSTTTSITLNGTLTLGAAVRLVAVRSFVGSLLSSATLTKIVRRILAATLTDRGTMQPSKHVAVTLTGAVLLHGTEASSFRMLRQGSLALTGLIDRRLGIHLIGSLAFIGIEELDNGGSFITTSDGIIWIERVQPISTTTVVPVGGALQVLDHGDIVWIEGASPVSAQEPIPVGGALKQEGNPVWIEGVTPAASSRAAPAHGRYAITPSGNIVWIEEP